MLWEGSLLKTNFFLQNCVKDTNTATLNSNFKKRNPSLIHQPTTVLPSPSCVSVGLGSHRHSENHSREAEKSHGGFWGPCFSHQVCSLGLKGQHFPSLAFSAKHKIFKVSKTPLHLHIHSVHKYLLGTYYIPNIVLSAWEPSMIKKTQNSCFHRVYFGVRGNWQ